MPLRHSPDSATIDRWMQSLIESTSENGIVMLTPDGQIVGWLGAAEGLFGYASDEAVGMPFSHLFTPVDVAGELDKQERRLALTSGRSEDDRWHVRKDGSRFWGSGVMESIRNEAGDVVALAKVLRDRTDVRTHVVSLQNRLQAAEEQNAARLASLTALAHELRNQVSPLNNLLGALEKTGGAQAPISSMRRQMEVMGRLLDDLVRETVVVAVSPILDMAVVELQPLLHHAASSMQATVMDRGQTLKVTVPDIAIHLEADSHRIDQILVNLLSNASKFTPRGGTLQLSVTIEDDAAAIRVEDDGEGIAPDVLPKIFDLFTRAAGSGAPEGLGVGLAVVKKLAELHGGFVEGRSPGRGKGSVFTVRLPLRQTSVGAGITPTAADGTPER